MIASFLRLLAMAFAVLTLSGCSPSQSSSEDKRTAAPPGESQTSPATKPADEVPVPPTPSPYDALPDPVRTLLDQPFTGDFDAMVRRRLIRAGVVFNRTQYF